MKNPEIFAAYRHIKIFIPTLMIGMFLELLLINHILIEGEKVSMFSDRIGIKYSLVQNGPEWETLNTRTNFLIWVACQTTEKLCVTEACLKTALGNNKTTIELLCKNVRHDCPRNCFISLECGVMAFFRYCYEEPINGFSYRRQ